MDLFQEQVTQAFQHIHHQISQSLVSLTKDSYHEDRWEYKPKGGGITRVWSDGKIIEKGGVNFSAIHGTQLPPAASAQLQVDAETPFYATGVSIVLHPQNPFIPTIHMNIRYFQLNQRFWFGGGIDLTPYYPEEQEVIQFHQGLKKVCDQYQPGKYDVYKKNCDQYFYLKHREEMRGVGGLFFDHLEEDPAHVFAFVQAVGNAFIPLYQPLIEANRFKRFSSDQRQFQLYRRGRYVEFNLLYDRGTLFGLQSGGRIESILMSLPPTVHWKYNWSPKRGSPEERLTSYFLKPRDWVALAMPATPE